MSRMYKLLVTLASAVSWAVSAEAAPPKQYKAVKLDRGAMLDAPEGLEREAKLLEPPRQVRWVRITGLPQENRQTLWSSWGDGCIASNGKYYTAIGDHLGVDATSLLYEFSPTDGKLRLVADISKSLELKPGQYGHGKVHSGIHEASDGWLYFSTYWGKHRQVEDAFGPDYQGSLVLRYRPDSGELDNLGAIVPRQGLPVSHFDNARGLLYFYAVYDNNLAVYDVATKQRVYLGGKDQIAGKRAFLRDARGRIYMSGMDGRMVRFDPQTQELSTTKFDLGKLPLAGGRKDNTLRAGLPAPLSDGTMVGMTASGRMFSIDVEAERLTDLGPNFGDGLYTAAMVASPDDRYVYYAPGAHGSASRIGGPIVRFDIQKRKAEVVAYLAQTLRQRNYQLGGSYNLQIDPEGRRLLTTFNGAPLNAARSGKKQPKQPTFGEPCVLELELN